MVLLLPDRRHRGRSATSSPRTRCGYLLTRVLKHPLDVEAVRGAGLVIGVGPLEVGGHFPGSNFVDASRVRLADGVLRPNHDQRHVLHVPELAHFGVVIVHGVEARLVLQTEDEDDGVDPRGKLQLITITIN